MQRRCETATAERGYQGSRPVRIGNSAVGQRQLDVYGELMDSVYLYNREVPISYDLWTGLCQRLDWLARHWQEPDEGIWEIRGPRQRVTYSALMTWVAYDRAGRLARDRGLPGRSSGGALTRAGRVREARMFFEKTSRPRLATARRVMVKLEHVLTEGVA